MELLIAERQLATPEMQGSQQAVVLQHNQPGSSRVSSHPFPINHASNLSPVTPIDPDHLYHLIRGSPHAYELYIGFKYGFQIPHAPSPWSQPIRNHQSVSRNPAFIDLYISKELAAGRNIGPFSSLPHGCIVSPLGLVPKKEAGSFRVIHDLSYPKGQGVNDLIPNHLTSVQYENFDHVAGLIRQAGAKALISKVDIHMPFGSCPYIPVTFISLVFFGGINFT